MVKGYLLSNYNSIAPIYERISILTFSSNIVLIVLQHARSNRGGGGVP